MSGIDWREVYLAVVVTLGLFLAWPAPRNPGRYGMNRWVRYATILATGLFTVSPAFPLVAERVGWPWCLVDDAILSVVAIRFFLLNDGCSDTSQELVGLAGREQAAGTSKGGE